MRRADPASLAGLPMVTMMPPNAASCQVRRDCCSIRNYEFRSMRISLREQLFYVRLQVDERLSTERLKYVVNLFVDTRRRMARR
jgi:hypothetical protein